MTKNKSQPKFFILDVDGVITDGQMTYSKTGKQYKVFGQDDHDSLKIIKKYLKVFFVSGDKIGFKISKKRVEDMGFQIRYVPVKTRENWIDEKFGLKNCIYMGDGIFDHLIMKKVQYAICPNGSLEHVTKAADYVTKNFPAKRAVAEAVVHILKIFFRIELSKINSINKLL